MSAGGHGGGLDGFLDAGSAHRRDSHRSTPPVSLVVGDGGLFSRRAR
ncbi:hypothetical protein STRIP9103_07954 [Streptomyces ipomoeae 91-03]|uniref:Uncharacterized protein n=1 Tax=Streptomyces ipomoeae 91-03 TaxID=698759 RepID=L1L3U5_9ACTN|nr:hypothetical protein STRIP9103_07954 [Streptomyces ipomoeae 91-03]